MSVLKKDFISKKVFISIIILVLIILCFFSYKIYFFYKYNPNKLLESSYEELIKKLDYKDTINIKKSDLKDDEEYISFENIKIRNDFENYKEFLTDVSDMEGYKSYKLALYDNDKVVSSFWISKYKTYTNIIRNSESIDLYNISDSDKKDDFYKKVIIDNDINTDLELIDFLKNDKVKNVNLFSKPYDIKLLYSKALFYTVALPSIDYLTLIEGDYSGYIINTDLIKEVNIEYKGEDYIFTFIENDNVFTTEYINDLLNTLIIEGE